VLCLFFDGDATRGVYVGACAWVHTNTPTLHVGFSDVSPGVGTRHLESWKNPERLKRCTHVDCIYVHSTFVYVYSGLRNDDLD